MRSSTTRRIRSLEGQIAKIKSALGRLSDLRPGSLSEQYNAKPTFIMGHSFQAVGPHQTFVNPAGQRNTEKASQKAFGEHSNRLKRVAHDERGLGVVL